MKGQGPLFPKEQLPKANLLRRLFHLLRFGAIDETVQIVRESLPGYGAHDSAPAGWNRGQWRTYRRGIDYSHVGA